MHLAMQTQRLNPSPNWYMKETGQRRSNAVHFLCPLGQVQNEQSNLCLPAGNHAQRGVVAAGQMSNLDINTMSRENSLLVVGHNW